LLDKGKDEPEKNKQSKDDIEQKPKSKEKYNSENEEQKSSIDTSENKSKEENSEVSSELISIIHHHIQARGQKMYPLSSKKDDQNFYNECLAFHKSDDSSKFTPKFLEGPENRKKRQNWRVRCKTFHYDNVLDRLFIIQYVSYNLLPDKFALPQFDTTKKLYEGKYYIALAEEEAIILNLAHKKTMHLGINRMRIEIHSLGYQMEQSTSKIRKRIEECSPCCDNEGHYPKNPPPLQQIIARFPMDIIQLDTVMLPKSLQMHDCPFLITACCHFSKYLWAEATTSKSAEAVKDFLLRIFSHFGMPKNIQTDNGREFENHLIRDMLEGEKISFYHGRPYHPQSQGLIESRNKLLQDKLKKAHKSKPFDLKIKLSAILYDYNTTPHSSTGYRPCYALELTEQYNSNIIKHIKKSIEKAFARKIWNTFDYRIGQKVALLNSIEVRGKFHEVIKSQKISKKLGSKGYFIPCIVTCVRSTFLKVKAKRTMAISTGMVEKDMILKCCPTLLMMMQERTWIEDLGGVDDEEDN
jgi:hypothetical protein